MIVVGGIIGLIGHELTDEKSDEQEQIVQQAIQTIKKWECREVPDVPMGECTFAKQLAVRIVEGLSTWSSPSLAMDNGAYHVGSEIYSSKAANLIKNVRAEEDDSLVALGRLVNNYKGLRHNDPIDIESLVSKLGELKDEQKDRIRTKMVGVALAAAAGATLVLIGLWTLLLAIGRKLNGRVILDGWVRLAIVASLVWIVGFAVLSALDFNSPYDRYDRRDLTYWVEDEYACLHPNLSIWLVGLVLPVAAIWFLLFAAKWVGAGFIPKELCNELADSAAAKAAPVDASKNEHISSADNVQRRNDDREVSFPKVHGEESVPATVSTATGITTTNSEHSLALWGLLFGASVLVALFSTSIETGFSGDTLHVLASALGKAMALILMPATPVWCVVLIRKLFRRPTSNYAIFGSIYTFWIFLVFIHIQGI